ncbi:MAG: XRE family transcriptional regulator [Micromonosporaceae bacterium]
MSDKPSWALRLRRERDARGWSQRDVVRALRARTSESLPEEAALLRTWKRWESGRRVPGPFYQSLIAKAFGTVTAALFPAPAVERHVGRDGSVDLASLELLSRLRSSDVDQVTLDSLIIMADQLCSDYRHRPAAKLRLEALRWLRQITGLLDRRLTLAQHREVLSLAGWVALLIGCLEYDMGADRRAEATRLAALSLGQEADHSAIVGWAYEMRAWQALTQGDYRGVVTASDAGRAVAPRQGVAVQLAAQRAKAWARLGDRRQVELALDEGRAQLETMPPPENPHHHFVVDPGKFDFYAMDCYRLLGEDRLATAYAEEVIRAGTDWDGAERSPMRIAEARITLGVAAARQGELEQAVDQGRRALASERVSLPSLLMISSELEVVLHERFGFEAATSDYLSDLRELRLSRGKGGRS